MRLVLRLLLGVALAYGLLVAGLVYAMWQPPGTFGQIMARMPMVVYPVVPFKPLWSWARAGTLAIGDEAPDFSLLALDKSQRVRLSAFRGERPVVLVFGSYT
jgi:hypothetical protein